MERDSSVIREAETWLGEYSGSLGEDESAISHVRGMLLSLQCLPKGSTAKQLLIDTLHSLLQSVDQTCLCCNSYEKTRQSYNNEQIEADYAMAMAIQNEEHEEDHQAVGIDEDLESFRETRRRRRQRGSNDEMQNELAEVLDGYAGMLDLEDLDDDALISMFLEGEEGTHTTRSGRKRRSDSSVSSSSSSSLLKKPKIKPARVIQIQLTDEQKKDRLAALLSQTDECLRKIKEQLESVTQTSQSSEASSPSAQSSASPEEPIEVAAPPTGFTLKDYQIDGVAWILAQYSAGLSCILGDEMGLGKTVQAISALNSISNHKKKPEVAMVVVPLSTISSWDATFSDWFPASKVFVYHGNPDARGEILNSFKAQLSRSLDTRTVHKCFVFLTTYEIVIRDVNRLKHYDWNVMIVDEAHRLKNNQSRLFETLNSLDADFKLLMTGTPLQNNLEELWSLLNFILPEVFRSSKDFMQWFNSPFESDSTAAQFEFTEEEKALVISRLQDVLRPFFLRRLKEHVLKDLPNKLEKVIPCPMSGLQRALYVSLQQSSRLNDNTKKFNNLLMQLRKDSSHPFLFRDFQRFPDVGEPESQLVSLSGKFWMSYQILIRLRLLKRRCLVFFQFTSTIDLFEDFLAVCGFQDSYLRLDGTVKAQDREGLLQKFNCTDSPFSIFLISTRCGGVGLNLQTADTVILFDRYSDPFLFIYSNSFSDWNPQMDLQAQARVHRIGQSQVVLILRLITLESVEEKILERAKGKLDMEAKVLQEDKFNALPMFHESEIDKSSISQLRTDDLLQLPSWSRTHDFHKMLTSHRLNSFVCRSQEELDHLNSLELTLDIAFALDVEQVDDLPDWFTASSGHVLS